MSKKTRNNSFAPSSLERARQGGKVPSQRKGKGGRLVRSVIPNRPTFQGSYTDSIMLNPRNVDPHSLVPSTGEEGDIKKIQWPNDGKVYYNDYAMFLYTDNEWRLVRNNSRPWYTGKNGSCYRTGCKRKRSALFYNKGTYEYYCLSCAVDIQRANINQDFVLFKEVRDALLRKEGCPTIRDIHQRVLDDGYNV